MVPNPQIRSRFLRVVVESLHRLSQGSALPQLRESLPKPYYDLLAGNVLRATSPTQGVALADGAGLLLALDDILGDGSGHALERAGFEIARQVLVTDGARAKTRDFSDTVRSLRWLVEYPFLQTHPAFQLEPTTDGFELIVGIDGAPAATRALRHLALGILKASAQLAGNVPVRFYANSVGDRSRITANFTDFARSNRYHSGTMPAAKTEARSSRPPRHTESGFPLPDNESVSGRYSHIPEPPAEESRSKQHKNGA